MQISKVFHEISYFVVTQNNSKHNSTVKKHLLIMYNIVVHSLFSPANSWHLINVILVTVASYESPGILQILLFM